MERNGVSAMTWAEVGRNFGQGNNRSSKFGEASGTDGVHPWLADCK